MKFTERFNKTLLILIALTLVFILWQAYLEVNGISGRSVSHPEKNTPFRLRINFLKGLFSISAFWLVLGYLFENWKAIIYGLVISAGLSIYHYFSPTTNESITLVNFLFFTTLNLSKYAVFGYLVFKHPKGLWLMLIPLIATSLNVMGNTYAYERFLNGFFRIVGWRDAFEFRIPTGENSYRPLSMIRLIVGQMETLVLVLVAWSVYHNVKRRNNFDFKFFDTYLHDDHKGWRYSIVYWSLRLTLAVGSMGIVSFIGRSINKGFEWKSTFWLLCFCLGFYLIASMYRNFMTSKFLSGEKIPNFLYFLLNVPILNFFAWIYSLFYLGSNVQVEKDQAFIDRLDKKFSLNGRNAGLKVMLIVLLGLTVVVQFTNLQFNSFSGSSGMQGTMIAITGLINISLLCWFLYDKNAYFILVILSFIGFFTVLLLGQEDLISLAKGGALVSLIYYVGLFYWDRLELIPTGTVASKNNVEGQPIFDEESE